MERKRIMSRRRKKRKRQKNRQQKLKKRKRMQVGAPSFPHVVVFVGSIRVDTAITPKPV